MSRDVRKLLWNVRHETSCCSPRSPHASENVSKPASQLEKLDHDWRGPLADLDVPRGRCLKKLVEFAQAFLRVLVGTVVFFGFSDALAEQLHGGIDLPFLAFLEHHPEHVPRIFQAL